MPVLKSQVFLSKILAKVPEMFVKPVALCVLLIVVYHKARGLMLRLYNSRQMSVKFLTEKFLLETLAHKYKDKE